MTAMEREKKWWTKRKVGEGLRHGLRHRRKRERCGTRKGEEGGVIRCREGEERGG